jgi:hypothetical protein
VILTCCCHSVELPFHLRSFEIYDYVDIVTDYLVVEIDDY